MVVVGGGRWRSVRGSNGRLPRVAAVVVLINLRPISVEIELTAGAAGCGRAKFKPRAAGPSTSRGRVEAPPATTTITDLWTGLAVSSTAPVSLAPMESRMLKLQQQGC